MRKFTGFLFSLSLGFLFGTLTGLLAAPEGGQQTRGRISFQFSRYKRLIKDIVSELLNPDPSTNTAQVNSQVLVNKTREKAKKLLEDVDGFIRDIKK
ncbi:MAG: YtxH domain-containing protein [Cytophagales bacterium]|nr:YtxH domain-containing protein [Cytophagales bacterium]